MIRQSRSSQWDYRPGLACDYCGAATWTELRANNQRQCRGCKAEKFFEKVLYVPLGFTLPAWSRKVLRDIYGTLDPSTGLRQFRRAYISMGKQSGKSHLVGGLPIYHILMEDEANAEVVGAGSARDQAEIVFIASSRMIDANPRLGEKLKRIPSTKRIIEREGAGIYKVISADGDVQDGQRPSLFIADELHRWKSLRHQTVRDVLTKGQISREEPLFIQITTAGAEYESQLWWNEYQFAKKVQKDQYIAPDYYVAIWEADRTKFESDQDYWKSREARVAANPSHEDLGGHIKDAALVGELSKSFQDPREKSTYVRYNLNIPTQHSEEPVINMALWQQNGDPQQKEFDKLDHTELSVDLRNWPEYDIDLLLKRWGLVDEPCYVGVDASYSTDFTAVVFCFPPTDKNTIWTFLPFFWIPADRIQELERFTRMPIRDWCQKGFISTIPGSLIDLRFITDRIKWGAEMFDLLEIDYDKACGFRGPAAQLQEDTGITAVEIRQIFMELSSGTKFLTSAYLEKGFRHGNNPVLNWMAGCLQVKCDGKELIQPDKGDRMQSAKRIDGMAAIVNAFARALTVTRPKKVTRGIVLI